MGIGNVARRRVDINAIYFYALFLDIRFIFYPTCPTPKIAYSRPNTRVKALIGDLGDGIHDASADDPRMALIEMKSNYITYR